jgi:hypothetical protein
MHRHATVDPACTLNFQNQNVKRLANNKDRSFPTVAHLIPVHSIPQSNHNAVIEDHVPVTPITPISVLESVIIGLYSMVHTGPARTSPIAENMFNSARRSGTSLGSNFMMPRGVYSVQPLCQVGQTPSHVRILPREMRLWGCTWVRGTVLLYFAEIREGWSEKSPIRSMQLAHSSDV